MRSEVSQKERGGKAIFRRLMKCLCAAQTTAEELTGDYDTL